MSRKNNEPKITQVIYYHSGTNEEFNHFLKSVVKDYITTKIKATTSRRLHSGIYGTRQQ